MKVKQINKKGFSLLEMSAVIIIISLILTAISQISNYIESAHATQAKRLTANSPVLKIDGLVLWLETSLEDSISYTSQSIGGDYIKKVDTWHDLSPMQNDLVSSSTATLKPRYLEDSTIVKGVPAISFNTTHGFPYLSTTKAINSLKYTIFIVHRMDSTNPDNAILLYNGSSATDSYSNMRITKANIDADDTTKAVTIKYIGDTTKKSTDDTDYNPVYSPNHDPLIAGDPNYLVRINKTKDTSNSYLNVTIANLDLSGDLWIGTNNTSGNYHITGELAEIIIFSRPLFTQEIKDIETYLYKKYQIIE